MKKCVLCRCQSKWTTFADFSQATPHHRRALTQNELAEAPPHHPLDLGKIKTEAIQRKKIWSIPAGSGPVRYSRHEYKFSYSPPSSIPSPLSISLLLLQRVQRVNAINLAEGMKAIRSLQEKLWLAAYAAAVRICEQQLSVRDGNSLFPDAGASNAVLRCAQRVQRANAVNLN